MSEQIATVAPERRRFFESGTGSLAASFGAAEWGLLAGIATIWGSSFLLIEIALRSFGPGVVAMGRVLLGALALGLFEKARRPVAREDLPRIAVLGVVWMGLPLLLFPLAQRWISSSVAGMINGAVPLMAAGWSVVLLRRLPRRPQLLGIVVGFLGIASISWPELQGSRATALGAGLVVLAVMFYGLAVNIAVPLQQRYGSLPVLLRAQVAALFVVVPFGLWSLPSSESSWGAALALVPLGILGTGVAFVMMTTLVGRVGPARGSVAIYFVPIVAIVLGAGLLGERISSSAIAGTALVLAGAWLTSRKE
ncbi:MAG: DMT family transporter [Thermoanaerobaculia bacterium]